MIKSVKLVFKAAWRWIRGTYVAAGYPLLPLTRHLQGPLRWFYHRSPLLKHDNQRHWKPWLLETLHELMIREHPQDFRIHGGQVQFRSTGSLMSVHAYYVGEVEHHLVQYVLSQLRPGFVMCDVGAHHGVFSVIVAHELRAKGWEGLIHSYEPDEGNFSYLTQNVRQNGLTKYLVLHREAVAEAQTKRKLVVYPDESSAGYLQMLAPEVPVAGKSLEEVSVTTLDSLLDQVPRVDLIKIDVQGAEPLVLAGAQQLVEKNRPIIVIEAMQHLPGIDAIRAFLQQHRYQLHSVNAAGRLCPLNSREAFVSWDWVATPTEFTASL